MKTLTFIGLFLSASVLFFFSCHTSKKNTIATTAANSSAPVSTTTVSAEPAATTSLLVRTGIVPGDLELKAIQAKYPDVTATALNHGYEIYSGKCTDCHRKKNIFMFSETKWKEIIDDMAPRSQLNAEETDDLYKYVLSMKATQNMYAK